MITDHIVKTPRHTTFHLSAGPEDATPLIFLHGWPELSISWRGQLPIFAGLGFRAVAPDMRGYGRSSAPGRREDYAIAEIERDMIELLDALGAERAVWVGHDWGAPVAWSIAQHHPERCLGVAALCVPYMPDGFTVETVTPYVDRKLYPEAEFPVGQWDYQLFYRESFEAASAAFDADPAASVRALFRAAPPESVGRPARTAFTRAHGGWFGGRPAPDVPRDPDVLTEADEAAYAAALARNGFFGPDSWYVNPEANRAHALRAKATWRLEMPVLFLHGAYDAVCETLRSDFARPMREWCLDLTEDVILSGHWMAQEKPVEVNAALARWLARKLPEAWLD